MDPFYRSEDEHSADCRAYPYDAVPGRIFLDTNVVNPLVNYPDQIFEQQRRYRVSRTRYLQRTSKRLCTSSTLAGGQPSDHGIPKDA